MGRLIDEDVLMRSVMAQDVVDKSVAKRLILQVPTVDAVAVVRCGQCSHSEVCKMDEGDVRYCHIFEMQTEDDYYCADGESLEEDDLPTSANHDEERREG